MKVIVVLLCFISSIEILLVIVTSEQHCNKSVEKFNLL